MSRLNITDRQLSEKWTCQNICKNKFKNDRDASISLNSFCKLLSWTLREKERVLRNTQAISTQLRNSAKAVALNELTIFNGLIPQFPLKSGKNRCRIHDISKPNPAGS